MTVNGKVSIPNELVATVPFFFWEFGTAVLDGPLLGTKFTSSNILKCAYHPFGHPFTYTYVYFYSSSTYSLLIVIAFVHPTKSIESAKFFNIFNL